MCTRDCFLQKYDALMSTSNSGDCVSLDPAWFYLTTETTFPAAPGNLITVKCPDGFFNQGSETITCQNGIHYKFENEPQCEAQGKHYAIFMSMEPDFNFYFQ